MGETKRCPYCGEEILSVAKKCKHCGEWLDKEDAGNGEKRGRAHNKSAVIIGIAAAVAATACALAIFMTRQPAAGTAGTQPETAEAGALPAQDLNEAEEFDFKGEAIAGYGDDDRATIYEYTFSGRLFNDTESPPIILKYIEDPVDGDGDGWFDVYGDYNYPQWQKNGSFAFEGRSSGDRLFLFTENSEMFDLMSSDDGYVLKGEWYKFKSNADRERDHGSWTKHLHVELKVSKLNP